MEKDCGELEATWALMRMCAFAAVMTGLLLAWVCDWEPVPGLPMLFPRLAVLGAIAYVAFLGVCLLWHVGEVVAPDSLSNVEDDYTAQLAPPEEDFVVPPIWLLPHERIDQLLFSRRGRLPRL